MLSTIWWSDQTLCRQTSQCVIDHRLLVLLQLSPAGCSFMVHRLECRKKHIKWILPNVDMMSTFWVFVCIVWRFREGVSMVCFQQPSLDVSVPAPASRIKPPVWQETGSKTPGRQIEDIIESHPHTALKIKAYFRFIKWTFPGVTAQRRSSAFISSWMFFKQLWSLKSLILERWDLIVFDEIPVDFLRVLF